MQTNLLYFLMKFFFYLMTIFLLSISSNWLMTFIFLEFNLFLVIWLMKNKMMEFNINLIMKYFLFQTMNSLFLIFLFFIFSQLSNYIYSMILFFFLIKMGLPPFFFWMWDLSILMNSYQLMILMVYQKLPIFLILFFFKIPQNFILFFLFSCFFGSLGIFNQSSFNILFFFSSMMNSSLILLALMISKKMFFLYFSMYFFMCILIMSFMSWNYSFIFNHQSNIFYKWIFFLLMGLPPSPLFIMKMMLFLYYIFMMSFFMSMFIILVYLPTMIIYFNWLNFSNFFSYKKIIFKMNNFFFKMNSFLILFWFLML